MAESSSTTQLCSLKLFVDKNSRKVLFAEAKKEFVDIIFALLSIPIGSIMAVVGKELIARSCLSTVYDSVQEFCTTCLLPVYQNNKAPILTPTSRPFSAGGFVKGTVTYIVLDDLTVKPVDIFSIIEITNKLKIEDVSSIDELVVDIGDRELSKVITAAFRSMTVLTDVFLNNGNDS